MEKFVDFIADNYLIFIIVTVFLIFALIGFFVEKKKRETSPFKIENNVLNNDLNISNIEVQKNMSLQDMVKENASINNKHSDNETL